MVRFPARFSPLLLPEQLLMRWTSLTNYAQTWTRMALGLDCPLFLIHFLTDRCNLSCKHCFCDTTQHAGNELEGAAIERLVRSLRYPLQRLVLTGGEPFLRSDLGEIYRIYRELNRPKTVFIDSNGYFPDRIAPMVESMLACSKGQLVVQLSLDGPAEIHDLLRASPGSFARLSQTVHLLSALRKTFKQLQITALMVLNRANLRYLPDCAKQASAWGIDFGYELVRGVRFLSPRPAWLAEVNPRSQEIEPPTADDFAAMQAIAAALPGVPRTGPWKPLDYSALIAEEASNVLSGKRKSIHCRAGSAIGVIHSNGDVSCCEFAPSIGNLAEVDYNLPALWSGLAMQQQRTSAKSCRCTHGCFLAIDTIYRPLRFARAKVETPWRRRKA